MERLFISQLEWNSVYSFSHISETKPMTNGRWAVWSSVICCSRFQNATAKNVVLPFSDTMTLYVHSSNDMSYLAPDYERCSRSSAASRWVRHYINWFYARIRVFNIQPLIRNERCPVPLWNVLPLNDPSGASPFRLLRASRSPQR
jgi:hypothetical protein